MRIKKVICIPFFLQILFFLIQTNYIKAENSATSESFELVSSVEDLKDGDEIIIVSSFTVSDTHYNYAMGDAKYTNKNKPNYNYKGEKVSVENDVINIASNTIQVFTITKEDKGWLLQDKNSNYLFAACFTVDKKGTEKGLWFQNKKDKYCYLSISISDEAGHVATMKFSDSSLENKFNIIGFNSETGTAGTFNCYKTLGGSEHEVYIYKHKTEPLNLNEKDSNINTLISENKDKIQTISLSRTFYENSLHTLCLPFDVTLAQMGEVFGTGTKLYEFSRIDDQQQMVFSQSTEGITAGKPYLIWAEKETQNPVFSNVTITSTSPQDVEIGTVKFCGTYSPYAMQKDGTEKFLNSSGKLINPEQGKNTMRGLRCYFVIPMSESNITSVSLSRDNTSSISNATAPKISKNSNGMLYSISGQPIGKEIKSIPNGIFIYNGKKMVVDR